MEPSNFNLQKSSQVLATPTEEVKPQKKLPGLPPLTLKLELMQLPDLTGLEEENKGPEWQRTQILYKIKQMHNMYGSYKEKYNRNVKKQRQLIDALEKQKKHLEEAPTNDIATILRNQTGKYPSLKPAITRCKKRIAKLKKKINKTEQRILKATLVRRERKERKDAKLKAFTRHYNAEINKNEKELSVLLGKNKDMRSDITHAMKKRSETKKLIDKKGKNIEKTKAIIHGIVEDGNLSYEEAQIAAKKLAALEERFEAVLEAHRIAMKDAQIELFNQRKLTRFYYIKLDDRIVQRLSESNKRSPGRHVENRKADEELAAYYETAHNAVTDLANNEDIDTICESFQQSNRDNYRLYKAILNYEAEIDRLENEKKDILDFFEEVERETSNQRTSDHEEIEATDKSLVEQAQTAEDMQKTIDKERKIINEVEETLNNAFDKLQIKKSRSLTNLLLGSELRDETLEEHIMLVEKKTRLMAEKMKFYKQGKEAQKQGALPNHIKRSVAPHIPKRLVSSMHDKEEIFPFMDTECIWPDDSDDELDDDDPLKGRVLTREELNQKASALQPREPRRKSLRHKRMTGVSSFHF